MIIGRRQNVHGPTKVIDVMANRKEPTQTRAPYPRLSVEHRLYALAVQLFLPGNGGFPGNLGDGLHRKRSSCCGHSDLPQLFAKVPHYLQQALTPRFSLSPIQV